ncbi:hypothetical protein BX600DRAFT_386736 [Xylariales sp. PMI_506]|nr:hypothetical protein BX600DRAFT_386736 [Xylariales sp. PMI_506]
MAVPGAEDVYLTLLLTDTYLPGALVLAHSLRDGGTTKKLGALVTLDSVSAEAITQLKASLLSTPLKIATMTVYDYVIPVPRIQNAYPSNLSLMNRADLHSAFTKINLWKQVNFRKIVYIDADVLAYRAPDELFDITHPFSAAPDIGWPDIFNTGVMVLTPDLGVYYALMAMAERGISFDGADQGLLNMHFKNSFNRLSFTYNVTPSAHYQYIPAYRHFQSSITMVHFIGADKPWFQGRYASTGSSPFDEMIGRWWAVYDRYYRIPSPTLAPSQPRSELVQYLTKGEYQPQQPHVPHVEQVATTGEPYSEHHHHHHDGGHIEPSHPHHDQAQQYSYPQHHDSSSDGHAQDHHEHHHQQWQGEQQQQQQHHHDHHHHHHHQIQHHPDTQPSQSGAAQFPSNLSLSHSLEGTETEARKEQVPEPHGAPPPTEQNKPEPHPISFSDWDAQRHPPPVDSKPEAANFPATVYEMSRDAAPFVPPERYPSPPKDMWYEVPKERPQRSAEKPRAIFPWEVDRPAPTRFFADDASRSVESEMTATSTATGEPSAFAGSQASAESVITEQSTFDQQPEAGTPTTPTIQFTPSDPWTSFTRTNAWDEVPEIERYVDTLQKKHRRTRSLKSPGVIAMPGSGGEEEERPWVRRGSKLTDFPSEVERPSLPVTPAPIRRPKFWGGGKPGDGFGEDENPLLPAAEGVPGQSEWVCVHGLRWKPADCLCDLTNVLRYHKDPIVQLQKLAKQQSEVLLQKLGGSTRDSKDLPSRPVPFGSEELVSPTYVAPAAQVLSPQPVKGSVSSSMVRGIISDDETTPTQASSSLASLSAPLVQPSYTGPGAAFEKGEDVPQYETPLPPSEEERDVLDT